MNWDLLARGFRRAYGYVKSIYEKGARSGDLHLHDRPASGVHDRVAPRG